MSRAGAVLECGPVFLIRLLPPSIHNITLAAVHGRPVFPGRLLPCCHQWVPPCLPVGCHPYHHALVVGAAVQVDCLPAVVSYSTTTILPPCLPVGATLSLAHYLIPGLGAHVSRAETEAISWPHSVSSPSGHAPALVVSSRSSIQCL